MLEPTHFYAVIIGSEILNRRRADKHFDYLSLALATKGQTLFASLTIKDDKRLITETFNMIQKDPKAVMFCFGGIGSTPDDLTRQLAADVFGDGTLYRHAQFEKDIIECLADRAYPHPITMSDLPKDSGLLLNPVNNMSGFEIKKRYFFMPGFPEMAQPMMDAIVDEHINPAQESFTKTLVAQCGEGRLIGLMKQVPSDIELSSLPMMNDGNPTVELSLCAFDSKLLQNSFDTFTSYLQEQGTAFTLIQN